MVGKVTDLDFICHRDMMMVSGIDEHTARPTEFHLCFDPYFEG